MTSSPEKKRSAFYEITYEITLPDWPYERIVRRKISGSPNPDECVDAFRRRLLKSKTFKRGDFIIHGIQTATP